MARRRPLEAVIRVRVPAPQLRGSIRFGCEHVFVSRRIGFTEHQLREAVAVSRSISEVLRHLGMRPAGGNHGTISKYLEVWAIPHDHFDPHWAQREAIKRAPVPLSKVMVRGSTYKRGELKRRLYAEGLKQPICELCGQGDIWHGRRMALILDHANGDATDNRLENLRIVCANCNATLDTHCGRNKPRGRPRIACGPCGELFRATNRGRRFCPPSCAPLGGGKPHGPADRPPYEQLLAEIAATSYRTVGRRYGVSDNAIRK